MLIAAQSVDQPQNNGGQAAAQQAQPSDFDGGTDQTQLISSRNLCYTVAWFEGAAERFQCNFFQHFTDATKFFMQIQNQSETRLILRGDVVLLQEPETPMDDKPEKLKRMAILKQSEQESDSSI